MIGRAIWLRYKTRGGLRACPIAGGGSAAARSLRELNNRPSRCSCCRFCKSLDFTASGCTVKPNSVPSCACLLPSIKAAAASHPIVPVAVPIARPKQNPKIINFTFQQTPSSRRCWSSLVNYPISVSARDVPSLFGWIRRGMAVTCHCRA
jgi:hypothetical protein